MSFKDYAKQAKSRLVNGFWEQVKQERKYNYEVAATNGSMIPVLVSQKDKLRNQIYSSKYEEDMAFEQKVAELLSLGEVANPILQLADKEIMESLSPNKRQAYLLDLSNRYRKVKNRLICK